MNFRRIIKETIREYLNENVYKDLILFHGSNDQKIITKFYDNQFYTVNDYVASTYAYNFNGLMYEVKVKNLNSFELRGYNVYRQKDEHDKMVTLLSNLYNENVGREYERNYLHPSPSWVFSAYGGWTPLIDWCKENGYDSIKLFDQSFDVYIIDTTYIIFDGNKPKITNIYEVYDAFESDFAKPFKKIKKTKWNLPPYS
jgi:hypothetical protein